MQASLPEESGTVEVHESSARGKEGKHRRKMKQKGASEESREHVLWMDLIMDWQPAICSGASPRSKGGIDCGNGEDVTPVSRLATI